MSSWEVKIDMDIDDIVEKTITPSLKKYIHARLWSFCDYYVPFMEGMLSSNVRFTEDGLTYLVPYAASMYNGEGFNFRKDDHPGATSRWDEAMMVAKGDLFAKDIENAINAGENYMESVCQQTQSEINRRYQEALKRLEDKQT